MKLSRLGPLAEQVANSLTSFLLTLILANVLTVAQFGLVTFIIIVLSFPIFITDSILGAAILFDKVAGHFSRGPRRLVLLIGTLIVLTLVSFVMVPMLAAFGTGFRDTLAPVGGAFAVVLTIAIYCIAQGGFENLRRMCYASNLPLPLLAVNGTRMLCLAGLFMGLKAGAVAASFALAFGIALAAQIVAFLVLAAILVRKRHVTLRLAPREINRRFLARTLRTFAPYAGTTVAYFSLELLLVTSMIVFGDPEAVARYRGIQLALLVMNLLCVTIENANAGRRVMDPELARQAFARSVVALWISGAVSVVGFLLLGRPIIAILLGPSVVPHDFELACGAVLIAAMVLRAPFATLLKFDNKFQAMFRVYVGGVLLEVVVLAALYVSGLTALSLSALVVAHGVTTALIVFYGWPLLRETFASPPPRPPMNAKPH